MEDPTTSLETLSWRGRYKYYKQWKLQALAIIYGSCTNAVKVYIKGMDYIYFGVATDLVLDCLLSLALS